MILRQAIERLQEIEAAHGGDLEVLGAADEEGNGFGDVWKISVNLSCVDDYEISLIHPSDWENYIEEAMSNEDIDREAAIEFLRKEGYTERVVIWP